MSFDTIVVGAGVIGSSIAWHLARDGARVALVDETGPASRPSASWASAGGLRSQGRHDADRPLTKMAAARWPDLSAELGADLEAAFGGHLHLAETEAEAQVIEARIAADGSGGIAIERLEASQIREIAPEVTRRALLGAYTPGDGQAHPGRVTRAFAEDAARRGAACFFGQRARPTADHGQVTGVTLADGSQLSAATTVLAAGAWTVALLEPLGLSLPVRARGLQMLLSDVAPRDLLAPTVTAVGRNLSLKQLRSGAFMIGGAWFARPTRHGLDTAPIDAHVAAQWSVAAAILPRLAAHKLVHQWAGTEAQSIDGNPFIGRSQMPGLYLACGFSNHGFQISPAVGDCVARDLATGRSPLLYQYTPARAASVSEAEIAVFRDAPILRAA